MKSLRFLVVCNTFTPLRNFVRPYYGLDQCLDHGIRGYKRLSHVRGCKKHLSSGDCPARTKETAAS